MPKRPATVRKKSLLPLLQRYRVLRFPSSGENCRPFTVRLFVESPGRDRQKPHRGIEPRWDCLTLFLLVFQLPGLVTPGPVGFGPPLMGAPPRGIPPLASFFGFRSRTLMFFFFLSCMFVTCPLLD